MSEGWRERERKIERKRLKGYMYRIATWIADKGVREKRGRAVQYSNKQSKIHLYMYKQLHD